MTHRTARISALAALFSLALAACGDDSGGTAAGTVPATAPTSVVEDVSGAGWIDGEPGWDASSTGKAAGAESAVAYDAPADMAAAAPEEVSRGEVVPGDVVSDEMEGPQSGAPLRAGSVDDNADFAGYLDYLQRIHDLGIPVRPFDPSGRIVVTVTGANGLPVAGQIVTVTPTVIADGADGQQQTGPQQTDAPAFELRTTADGQVVFLPAEYGDGTVAGSYMFSIGAAAVTATPGSTAALTLAEDGGRAAGMPVDVLFLLDVTGSMGDEIAQLKATISEVAGELAGLPQAPDVHFGMTLFRDEGDVFVTSTYDFTSDVPAFQLALDDVVADGGGDTPEAVDEALAAALAEPSWRDPASTVQLVFLVGDAAPQVGRQVDTPYTTSILDAASRGITVHAVGASNTDDSAEVAFREIAEGTGGRFVFLSYGAAGTATGPSTDIASTDYEELSLDDLVVRLVGEELAALTGTTFVDTTPDPVPSTNPPQQ